MFPFLPYVKGAVIPKGQNELAVYSLEQSRWPWGKGLCKLSLQVFHKCQLFDIRSGIERKNYQKHSLVGERNWCTWSHLELQKMVQEHCVSSHGTASGFGIRQAWFKSQSCHLWAVKFGASILSTGFPICKVRLIIIPTSLLHNSVI